MFYNQDFDRDDAHLYICASTAVPGIFPPVSIGDDLYVDGGVRMNTPLRPAIYEEAEILHVIDLLPPDGQLPTVTSEVYALDSTLAILERTLVMSVAGQLERDIRRAEAINWDLEENPQKQDPETGRTYRKLTIHRYRPRKFLGGFLELLNLKRERVEEYIHRGYYETNEHDCDKERCILPSAPASSPLGM